MFKRTSKKFDGDPIACSMLYPFAISRLRWLNGIRGGMYFLSKTFTFADGSLIHISCTDAEDSVYIKSGAIFDYIFGGLPGTLIDHNSVEHAYGRGFGAMLATKSNYKEVSYELTGDAEEDTKSANRFKRYDHLFLSRLEDGEFRNEYSFQPMIVHRTFGDENNTVSGSSHINEHLHVYRYGAFGGKDLGGEINSFNIAFNQGSVVTPKGVQIGSNKNNTPATITFQYEGSLVSVRGKYSLQVIGIDWIYDLTTRLPSWVGQSVVIKLGTATKYVKHAVGESGQKINDPSWKVSPDGEHLACLLWKYVDYGDKTLPEDDDSGFREYWIAVPYLTTIALNPFYNEEGELRFDNMVVTNHGAKPSWGEVDYYYGYGNVDLTQQPHLLVHTEVKHEEFLTEDTLYKYKISRLELFADGVINPIIGCNVYVGKYSKDNEGEWKDISDKFAFNRVYFDLRYGTCCEFRRSPSDNVSDLEAYGYYGTAFNAPVVVPVRPEIPVEGELYPVGKVEFVDVYWPTTPEGGTENPAIAEAKFFAEVRGTDVIIPNTGLPYQKLDVIDSQHKLQATYKNQAFYDVVPFTVCQLDTVLHEYKLSCLLYGMDGYFDLIDINDQVNIDEEGEVILSHENILGKIKTGDLLEDGTPEFVTLPDTDDNLRYTFVMHGAFL